MSSKRLVAALALPLSILFATALLPDAHAAGESARSSSRRASSGEDLLARTVFQTLIGEMALHRGDLRLATDAWSDLAQRTRDPKVIARAIEVAGTARQFERALELSNLWLSIEPNSATAQQHRSSLLILTNRLDELAPQLAVLLEQDKNNLNGNLMHLNRMLARHPDKKAVLHLIERITAPYPQVPEAHFALAQAALGAGERSRSLSEIELALQLRSDWEPAALLRAQIEAERSTEQAVLSLQQFVNRNPSLRDARMTLARLLVSNRRYEEARAHFNRLLRDNPENPEVIYPVAILALQDGDSETGRRELEHLLKTDFPDKSTVNFFLGQLAQDRQDPEQAAKHFALVSEGEQYLNARSRLAQILWQQGKTEAARQLLHETQAKTNSERAQLLIAEAALLRDAQRNEEALATIESGLESQPDDLELLYESAMLCDRLGRHDQLESRLQQLLKLKPDHAHALNALGYSLADRNLRLDEALQLINRALALLPDDPYITDSLGWVHFRRGELNDAVRLLQQAFTQKQDPEIAAHLSEVLAALDRRREAETLLRNSLRQNPEHPVLRNTLQRLFP